MKGSRHHKERHRTDRIGWPPAAVLGANDGIVSPASLLVGVAAAASFAVGAALPLAVTAVAPEQVLIPWVSGTSLAFLAFLALLGAIAARVGGANMPFGAWRVTFWGALAMAIAAGVGVLFGGPA